MKTSSEKKEFFKKNRGDFHLSEYFLIPTGFLVSNVSPY
jgi:hypothetical protein